MNNEKSAIVPIGTSLTNQNMVYKGGEYNVRYSE